MYLISIIDVLLNCIVIRPNLIYKRNIYSKTQNYIICTTLNYNYLYNKIFEVLRHLLKLIALKIIKYMLGT